MTQTECTELADLIRNYNAQFKSAFTEGQINELADFCWAHCDKLKRGDWLDRTEEEVKAQ